MMHCNIMSQKYSETEALWQNDFYRIKQKYSHSNSLTEYYFIFEGENILWVHLAAVDILFVTNIQTNLN